jgi:hypothetical protein
MPEPRAAPGTPPILWPATLPNPNAAGFAVRAGQRAEPAEVLFGPTRLALKARTAPMTFTFAVEMTREQMEIFEGFYRDALENHDGEFYARWIGGGRIVAFSGPYQYVPLGVGWVLSGTLIRTRIDESACDEFIESVFGDIYRADLTAPDIYEADLAATEIYADDFSLQLIADNEC